MSRVLWGRTEQGQNSEVIWTHAPLSPMPHPGPSPRADGFCWSRHLLLPAMDGGSYHVPVPSLTSSKSACLLLQLQCLAFPISPVVSLISCSLFLTLHRLACYSFDLQTGLSGQCSYPGLWKQVTCSRSPPGSRQPLLSLDPSCGQSG